ncbi:type II secretion system protein D precursor [mine drainage metagenome]|uniref:Type II secretion system protein D n=1 Tax=mine drainage metagenome TaxID=410659 RepID=A0A1J5TXQ9_9ZZZZ
MIQRPFRIWLVAALLAVAATAASAQPVAPVPAPAKPATTKPSGSDIIPNLRLIDGDIDSVLSMLEMLSGRSIIRPASLPTTTYTIDIKRPIPRSEAIQVIETVLSLNNIGVTPMGDHYFKVVALAALKTEAPQLISGSTLGLFPSGRVAAKLFQPKYLRIEDFQQQINGLVSPGVGGAIVPFPKANALLVTDTISNLQRIETLMDKLDKPAPEPKFYTLKFAKASDLVQKIQLIMQNPTLQGQLGATPTITADDRTNQVILVAEPQQRKFFDDLIARLDIKADPNTRTDVIYLKHANAKDVASLLTQVISGQNNAAQKIGAQSEISRPQANNRGPANLAQAASIQAASPSTSFSSIVTVLADERTNSVIVNGTQDDIRLIKQLVDKIDVILPQVRIEVVVAEVKLTNNFQSGIDELGLQLQGNRLVGFAGSTAGLAVGGGAASGSTGSSSTTPSGFASLDHPGYTLSGILGLSTTPRFSMANILSDPTIVTTHNKKATIKVVEQRPVISSYQNTAVGTNTVGSGYLSNVSYKDIGITLTVTPLIGDDGSVQMDIDQTVSDPLADVIIDGNAQPDIETRSTTSFVTVHSGQIVVLGGLQKTERRRSTSRLGPIPFIGDLLGTRTKSTTRTDLIFFIRPTILTNPDKDDQGAMKTISRLPIREDVEGILGKKIPPPPSKKPFWQLFKKD